MRLQAGALAIGLVFFGATAAQAAPILGSLWAVPDAIAANAIPANIPGSAPNVTFQVNAPLDFSPGGSPSVNAFLLDGGAFDIVGSPADLSRQLSDGIIGSLIELTGFVTVTTGQTFSVGHDDGLTLIIGGLDLGFGAGPTPPTVTLRTYTGPSGTFPFQLVYGECCAGDALLVVDLPFEPTPTVPEPGTVALLGSGLAYAAMRRRARRVR